MKSIRKRTLALTLAAAMTAGAIGPAASAVTIPASCDETYYATLDYYGQMKEGSVVKSYRLNGATSVADYGTYDEVINLSDDSIPTVNGDTVIFELGEEAPEKFYFEGKTAKPFEELPWDIAVSYRLNGASVPAEDLAGRTGLVEIALDVTRNPRASEYSKSNLVLTAAAAFNDDDITSLEAPGAEVQMVGNLRTVLFMVLPGEEQHFVIRVGSEDFSFSGLILLAVPATLQQLEQVAELREAKEKGEDSLDSIGDSMDTILNTLEGMSGNLNTAATGLDRLDSARGTVSGGKNDVYAKADVALGDLKALAGTLGSLDRYADTASQAIADLNQTLNGLNGTVQELGPELENTRKTVEAIQRDTKALGGLLGDVEGYNKRATDIAASLASELGDLEENMDGLEFSLRRLESALRDPGDLPQMDKLEVSGMSSKEDVEKNVAAVTDLHNQFEANKATLQQFDPNVAFDRDGIVLMAFLQGYQSQVQEQVVAQMYQAYVQQCGAAGVAPDPVETFVTANQAAIAAQVQAYMGANFAADHAAFLASEEGQAAAQQGQAAAQLWALISDPDKKAELMGQVETLELVNSQVRPVVNGKIGEIDRYIRNITRPTANVVDELADMVEDVGDTGMTDDLAALARLCRDLLKTMKEHEGEGADLLEHADELGDLASRVTVTADGLLERVDELNGILNTYEPELQAALTDVQTLSGSAQSTLHDLAASLSAMEELLRSAGPQLDAGTRETLAGVSASLRRATVGLDEVDAIRDAKKTIRDLIDEEWDTHSGQVDGLLNIDAGADPVSVTDPRNPTPGSVQYVMRTQEIKAEDVEEETAPRQEAPAATFWGRVAAMFRGIWEDIKKILHLG